MNYDACKMAHEMLEKMNADLSNGAMPSIDDMDKYNTVLAFCMNSVRNESYGNYWAAVKDSEQRRDHHKTVAEMYHTDARGVKHKGEHWTMEQTSAVAKDYGITADPHKWHWAMNAMWHDHCNTIKAMGVVDADTELKWYVHLAKDYLYDEDR